MRSIFVLLLLMGICGTASASYVERHNFFARYDPSDTSNDFVYDDISSPTATGDAVAVNGYLQKSVQITGVAVNEDIHIRIEGRSANQVNTAGASFVDNFGILDEVHFGSASGDGDINQVVDVTEYVDFLRVGIRNAGSSGVSLIDIEGIFTNMER